MCRRSQRTPRLLRPLQACTTTMGLTYLLYRETVKMVDHPPEGYVPLRPSTGALANWGPYVALAVPAVMSYCMEGWATEVLIFLSGAWGVCGVVVRCVLGCDLAPCLHGCGACMAA